MTINAPKVDAPAGGTAPNKWPGYLAAAWGLLFAVPSFVWALGYTFGADSTVSPALVKLARDQVPWFLAVLWITGLLKLFGAVIGVGLTRPRGRRADRFLVFCGTGAAVLLVWHGALFVIQGLLVETHVIGVKADLETLTRWYLYLWGPWFVLGGVTFGLAASGRVRHSDERPTLRRYALVAALGAALLSLVSTLGGVG